MDEIEDERLEEALRARRNLGVTQDVLHEHEAVSFNEAFVVERHRGGWSDSALGRVEEPAQVAREDVAVVSHVANPVPASAIRSTFTLGWLSARRRSSLVVKALPAASSAVTVTTGPSTRERLRRGQRRAVDRSRRSPGCQPGVAEGHGREPVVHEEPSRLDHDAERNGDGAV